MKPAIGIRRGGKYANGVVPEPSVLGFMKDRAQAALGAFKPTPQPPGSTLLQPAVEAAKESSGMIGQVARQAESYNERMNRAMEYADGTSFVHGPKGIDKVKGVSLMRGEAVLPADTTAAIGPENIAKIIEQTHTPINGKPQMGVRRGGKYADGVTGEKDKFKLPMVMQPTPAPKPEVAMTPERAAQLNRESQIGLAQEQGAFARKAPEVPKEGVYAITKQRTESPVTQPAQPARQATPPVVSAPKEAEQPRLGAMKPVAQPAAQTEQPKEWQAARTPQVSVVDQAHAYAKSLARPGDPPEIYSSHFNQALKGIPDAELSQAQAQAANIGAQVAERGANTEGALRSAQAAEAKQRTEALAQETALQAELNDPSTPPARRSQLQEKVRQAAAGSWDTYQDKDAMGSPIGEPFLINKQTGETKPLVRPGGVSKTPTKPLTAYQK